MMKMEKCEAASVGSRGANWFDGLAAPPSPSAHLAGDGSAPLRLVHVLFCDLQSLGLVSASQPQMSRPGRPPSILFGLENVLVSVGDD